MKQGARLAISLGIHCLVVWQLFAWAPRIAAAEAIGPVRRSEGESGKRISGNERRTERGKRLLLRTLDDLGALLALTGKEMAELEREIDAITPLESPARAADLRDLIAWYSGYSDWLKDRQAEFDSDLARISSGRAQAEGGRAERFAEISVSFKEFEKQLEAIVRRFDMEAKRLAKIIDRRRDIQTASAVLEERLIRIERKLVERPGKREPEEWELIRLRGEIRAVQAELMSLPQVDEDILKHYANLNERARAEGDWLLAKSDEYGELQDVSALVSGRGVFSAAEVEAVGERVRRMYEREIERMQGRIASMDRKGSLVSPAGTLRELKRSAELHDFYIDQKQRYAEYINRLKIRLGALEADLSEL